MTRVILDLDSDSLQHGFVNVTKMTERGRRKGQMDLHSVVTLLNDVFRWDANMHEVRMVSKFAHQDLIALGQNGAKWEAVKEIPSAHYFLISSAGNAHHVRLPRLIARVGNHTTPRIFWANPGQIKPGTAIYPLRIGNVDEHGRVCLGNIGIRCESPRDIDRYIRRIIESPASDHLVDQDTEELYRAFAEQWDKSIGKACRITVRELIGTE
ncbi:MAG: hypothetical protein HY680_06280 [Chloroflexi bacterium]|nr:hypothetical protein [Chloroflexota bacterium]